MEINIKLNKNFTTQYNKLQAEYGTDIARINGFDDGQLSYTDFLDNFVAETTVADASIDGNSNVGHKDIVTLEKEMPKPHEKLIAFNKIYLEIQKKYGFQAANEWLRAEWVGELYMHDANTTSFKHYCFAYDLKDLAEKGLYFIEGRNAEPAQHLTTFVDFVKEFISYASNRSSGAVGLPNLIPYMFYFWKKDVEDNYILRNPKYYAKQAFQRFIHAVNQPYVRDGSQSAFTNTSVFDRPYFEALFGGAEFPDGTFMIDYEEEIIEFQKWYMEVMAEIRHKNMFTFPVVGDTIPHEVIGKFGAASVWMKPAAPGTGVIAGAGVRLVLEAAGIKDVLAKSLGSTNPCNLVYATLEALKLLKSKEAVNVIRGKAEAVKAEEKPAAEVAAN